MAERNIGIADIWRAFRDAAEDRVAAKETLYDVGREFDELWQAVVYDRGFNGEMFSPLGKFMDNEYRDTEYMRTILTKEEYEVYCNFREIPVISDIEYFANTHNEEACLKVYVYHSFSAQKDSPVSENDIKCLVTDIIQHSNTWMCNNALEVVSEQARKHITLDLEEAKEEIE